MRIRVSPGGVLAGEARVPGDKSIAHRLLLLAAVGSGRSVVGGLPPALDVAATARACVALLGDGGARLEAWLGKIEGRGSEEGHLEVGPEVEVEGAGREALRAPAGPMDCGNSGTTMRLLAGVLSAARFPATLDGDASLRARPMERVADPLRRMGAVVETTDGRPPVAVRGAPLTGIRHETPVPSAQVKGAVLLAGIAAEGTTEVVEPAQTRDHTERLLSALGASVRQTRADTRRADSKGAPGLNPSRLRFLDVLGRMGARVEQEVDARELGEPAGTLRVASGGTLSGTTVTPAELPEVIDEIPLLAVVAAGAAGESRFEGAGELRVKESDRLAGLRELIRGLGGEADVDGDALVVRGGGLEGGVVDGGGDHRMAMAAVVGALAARRPSEVLGAEAAAVSYPGFATSLRHLGARLEVAR